MLTRPQSERRRQLQIVLMLFALDWPFVHTEHSGPPPDVQAALEEFWRAPEREAAAQSIDAPQTEWPQIGECVRRLAAGEIGRQLSPSAWAELAVSAEELAAQEPLAGAVVALHSVAILSSAGHVFRLIRAGRELAAECGRAVLALVRSLRMADAIWTAMEVARVASEAIEAQRYITEEWESMAAEFRQVIQACERRYSAVLVEVCEAARASFATDAHVRAALAALAWNAGDVPHATALTTMESLPLALAAEILDETFRRMPVDPYGQMILLSLQDSSVRLRDHPVLHTVANNVFSGAAVHRVDEVMPRQAVQPIRISRAYGDTLMATLAGRLDEAGRERFAATLAAGASQVRDVAPSFFLRLAALAERLELDSSVTGINGHDLGEHAVMVQREIARAASGDGYDRSTSIPFFTTTEDRDLEALVQRMERLRCSARWYNLTVVPPHDGSDDLDIVAERERPLLEELRALRLVQLLPDMPTHYQYATVRADDPGYEPLRSVTDLGRAERRIDELITELEQLWRESDGDAHAYGRRRLEPVPTLAQFKEALATGLLKTSSPERTANG